MGPLDKINPQNKDKIIQAHLQQEIDILQSKVNDLQKKYDAEENKAIKDGIEVELEAEKILLGSKEEVLEALLKGTSVNEETKNIQPPIITTSNETLVEDNTTPLDEQPQNPETEEKKEIDEETMNKLMDQMKTIFEVEKKIAELKQEKFELEQFINEQDKLEKEKQLKEKAIEVITAAKRAKMKKDDPLLARFSKELIDAVYDDEKLGKPETKKVTPNEVVVEPVIEVVEENIVPTVSIIKDEILPQLPNEVISPKTIVEEPVIEKSEIKVNTVKVENKEVVKTYFAKFPYPNDKTFEKGAVAKEQNGEYVYEIKDHGDDTATLTLSSDRKAQVYALNDFNYLMKGFDSVNQPLKITDTIELLEEGEATRQGDNWIITKKPRIQFVSVYEQNKPQAETLTQVQELKADFYGAAPTEDGFIPAGGIRKEATSYTPFKFENIPNQDKAYVQLIVTPEFMKSIISSPLIYIQSIYEPTASSVPYKDIQNIVILKHAVFNKENGGWRIKDKGIVRLEK